MKNPFPSWLKTAVFYQIYPQSFSDSNGDGIGDIGGIIQRLDYLEWLGINAIWINPCFDSPFGDAGYDIADYTKIASRYGSIEDIRELFVKAKEHGIRVLLDLVPGHTSIEHQWFKQSATYLSSPYDDYYIWTSNAWEWDVPGMRVISGLSERDASFITNFFYFQPALNYGFAKPDPEKPWQQPVDAPGPQQVRREMKKVMEYWLDQGASGFRVDMAFSLVKNDPGRHETIKLWQEVRTWLDEAYPEACLVSEWGNAVEALEAGFHIDFCLPFAMPGYTALLRKPSGPGGGSDPYGFSFFDRNGHGNIEEFLADYLPRYQKTKQKGMIAIPTGNHDLNPRLGNNRSQEDLTVIFTFLMTMPGTPFIYYGDEIGMPTMENLPSKEGGYNRTGSRTPMQWDSGLNAGFSSADLARLYLPVDSSQNPVAVEQQQNSANSLLNKVKQLITIRKTYSALAASGEFQVIYAEAGKLPFLYKRFDAEQEFIIAINPSDKPVEILLQREEFNPEQSTALFGPASIFFQRGDHWLVRLPPITSGIYKIG